MHQIFIDGQNGTTGLQIVERLKSREDIALIELSESERKEASAKAEAMTAADVTILCLPDDAARAAANLVPEAKIIDASTAHRTDPRFVYGLPELGQGQRQNIEEAMQVSNPGCYPTGFILLMRPLVEAGLVEPDQSLFISAISGYSGGGKSMIEDYQRSNQAAVWPYALSLNHKHLPEMQAYAGLSKPPVFLPHVGDFYQGMLVEIGLTAAQLTRSAQPQDIVKIWRDFFEGEPNITVHEANDTETLQGNFLDPQGCNGTNRVDLFDYGHGEQHLLIARLDNLGKGASGAAVQNLNLMLGLNEHIGLSH